MTRFAILLTALAFVTGAVLAAPAAPKTAKAKARVFKGEIWDEACARQGTHETMANKYGIAPGPKIARECTLECHRMGSPLVLYVPSKQSFYLLDDQAKAKTFAGEKVKITGTLDVRANTIHVVSFAAGS